MIQTIHDAHQRLTVSLWFVFIKEIELGDALAVEVTQHYTSLHVAPPFQPDAIQRLHSHTNDVTGVVCRDDELPGRLVAVEHFTDSVRAGPDEHGYLSAELTLTAQLLSGPGGKGANGFPHVVVMRLPKEQCRTL